MLEDIAHRAERARKILTISADGPGIVSKHDDRTVLTFSGKEGSKAHEVSVEWSANYDPSIVDGFVSRVSGVGQGDQVSFAGSWLKPEGGAWKFDAQIALPGKAGLMDFAAALEADMTAIEAVSSGVEPTRSENKSLDESRARSGDLGVDARPVIEPKDWSKQEILEQIPVLLASGADYAPYAGIGSRETPEDVMEDMRQVASALEARGFTMRSGGAPGADTAFEDGVTDKASKEIFIPWKGFANVKDGIILDRANEGKARSIAAEFHPAWERCSDAAKKLHTRNVPQIFGKSLDQPVRFVMAWTKDGGPTGGTGQAIRIAHGNGIAVLNFHDPDVRKAIKSELGIGMQQQLEAEREAAKRQEFAQPDRQKHSSQSTSNSFDLTVADVSRYDPSKVAAFSKVKGPHGAMSNMHNGYPFVVDGVQWPSSEALYQAMRFPHLPKFQEEIRLETNAFAAKQKAYERISESREDWDQVKHHAMAYAISRKLTAPGFEAELQATQGKPIVELSYRDRHWGAAPDQHELVGRNMLGRLLDQAREGARMYELPPRTKLLGLDIDPERLKQAEQGLALASKGQTVSHTTGNIVDAKAELLVNTVNARLSPSGRGVMGKGVALAFKERYPSIMPDYEAAIRSGELRAGRAMLFDLPDGRKWCALATKDHWQEPSKLEWVDSALKELGQKAREAGLKSIALPPPGCGQGGLKWKDVQPLVTKHLEGFELAIYNAPGTSVSQSQEVSKAEPEKQRPAQPAGREGNARVAAAAMARAAMGR